MGDDLRGVVVRSPRMARAAERLGVREEVLASRLRTGEQIGEATTSGARQRVAHLQTKLLREWHTSIARWRQRVDYISKGVDPWGGKLPAGPVDKVILRAQALAEMEASLHKILDETWREGYRLGYTAMAGQSPIAYPDRFLSMLQRQHKFATRFASDVAGDIPSLPGRMSIAARSELWAKSLAGAFNAGAVDTADPEELIWWRLGSTDHCTDCPVLAVSSPYTANTLPCLPGDGTTECHSNCACHLEFVRGDRVAPAKSDKDMPLVDSAINPKGGPPGTRPPTDQERVVMRDMEARVNHARRMMDQTRGTKAQEAWVSERRAASQARREYLEKHKIWDPPKFDTGQVVRGADVSRLDVRELTTVRGIDGRTASRAGNEAQRSALDTMRSDLKAALGKLPASTPGGDLDIEKMLVDAGAPRELFPGLKEELVAPDPARAVWNGIGFGARRTLEAHVAALETLFAGEHPVEVGPFDDRWLDLVLVGGTWIAGPPADVAAFVAAWKKRAGANRPAMAQWSE